MDLTSAVARIQARIAAVGDPARVRIVAVTKGQPAGAVRAALAAGLTDVGESRAQELIAKAADLGGVGAEPPLWHFVGRVQTNKVRQVAHLVSLWQSVDRLGAGEEIARRAPGARVLVQVNVTRESQKGGCPPAEAAGLVAALQRLGLEVEGLMTVGVHGDLGATRAGFRLLASLADDLGLAERSMGMTEDLEVAVEEGATMVRVGRALFGAD